MTEMLKSCPFCGGVAGVDKTNYYFEDTGEHAMSAFVVQCRSCGMKTAQYRTEDSAIKRWNRRAERTWHDFSDELPPVGASVLCRGRNGALYVGKPVTFKGNGTRKVWVPMGDQYRTPEKWMEIEDAD